VPRDECLARGLARLTPTGSEPLQKLSIGKLPDSTEVEQRLDLKQGRLRRFAGHWLSRAWADDEVLLRILVRCGRARPKFLNAGFCPGAEWNSRKPEFETPKRLQEFDFGGRGRWGMV
jgi:hypothetical protein